MNKWFQHVDCGTILPLKIGKLQLIKHLVNRSLTEPGTKLEAATLI